MKILKFGGSSVATPQRIKNVIRVLRDYKKRGEKFSVVFSAFGGVTDDLIEMCSRASNSITCYGGLYETFRQRHIDAVKALLKPELQRIVLKQLEEQNQALEDILQGIFLVREASSQTLDYVLSFGERYSNYIIANALTQYGIPASFLDARTIIKTDKNFGSAKVDLALTYEKIRAHFSDATDVQVVTGFIGSTKDGLTTTLGRGGSDYTCALLAAGLKAEAIEIWTDVDGVLTANPKKVKKAFTIPSLTYGEAMELSHFGAKVIYSPTITPAFNKKIPIFIKNTFNPSFGGTFISEKKNTEAPVVKGISSIDSIALLTLSGSGLFGVPSVAGRLFNALAKEQINVILITHGSSEHSISFAIQPNEVKKSKTAIEQAFKQEIQFNLIQPLKIEKDLAVVAIVGENMRHQSGTSGKIFCALEKSGINVIAIAQGSSEYNTSVVIKKADEVKALNALHTSFFLSHTKVLHLFVVGAGLVGSALIRQIKEQVKHLKESRSLEIKIVGLSNSTKMLFNEKGIDLSNWKTHLSASEESTSLRNFIDKMKAMNLPNTIFLDNTADKQIASFYEEILDNNISISTPNKIAASSSYAQYQLLKQTAEKRGVQFMYETNVGAGLPIISTLNDLINSGDRIIKIEAVLSGSLSFIFNSFKEGKSFSSIVKKAKALGYTEPDPREDLSGTDVRRKLTILSREAGLNMEFEDVTIQNILPQNCQNATTVEQFFTELEKADEHFEERRKNAERKDGVLRMIAKLEEGKASVELECVNKTHPFYAMTGSDNVVLFTTERYKERALVIRGPGAGAEVTAAGVFAEVIKIGNFLN